jgi:hypothetical protein
VIHGEISKKVSRWRKNYKVEGMAELEGRDILRKLARPGTKARN